MTATVGSVASRRFCLILRHSTYSRELFLIRSGLQPVLCYQPIPLHLSCRRLATDAKSLQPSGTESRRTKGSLTDPLADLSNLDADNRRSADPNNELKEYIEYSKVNSWHAAVGRGRAPVKQRWRHERLVIGVSMITFLAYVYLRPENSIDEQFGMDEFGKGLFRPHPAMEHHIAGTIQAVEKRGSDATPYRNQLKILLKEKELEKQRQQMKELQAAKGDVKYDPKINDVKY